MNITLSAAEIFQITRKKQPAAQIRTLKAMGIRCHRTDDPDQPVTVVRDWLTAPTAAPVQERMKPVVASERTRLKSGQPPGR